MKLSSPEEAVRAIKSGDRIVLANLCAEPHLMPRLLMDRAHELDGVRLFHCRPFGSFVERCLEPGMEEHLRCVTVFAGGVRNLLQLIKDGRADFYPIPLSRIPWLFRAGPYRPDVFITTLSPPDEQGYCSLGVSVDYARAALETAGVVIGEMNESMPRTSGDSLVHTSQIDYMVRVAESIYEMPSAEITSDERKLGEQVAGLVEDEATIQIGFGSVSEAVTSFLKEKKDLGMHTEMLPESAMTLIEEGALTGGKKTIHQGKIVCTFCAGTKRLYDWLNENPQIEMRTVDYTNDSRIIALNNKMTSINTALQVDLYGNIYSDSLGFDLYSGAGGQPDFMFGTQLCPNGKSIIVLLSTASKGSISRIVVHPKMSENPRAPSMPTVTRFHSDYVVTEWGVASLRNLTVRERAQALIEIAHPDFRDELRRDAKKVGLTS